MKRRRVVPMAAVAAVASIIGWLLLIEPPSRAELGDDGPLVIAHRGFGTLAPDNSLAAVRMALDSGVDGVDMDAQLSADGHVVVFHDFSVDRLTDGTGRVRDLTLAELKVLDLGVGYDAAFTGERIPTLEEVIRASGSSPGSERSSRSWTATSARRSGGSCRRKTWPLCPGYCGRRRPGA